MPLEPVAIRGAWVTSSRRTYADAAQQGSGAGPFVDVVDARWTATCEATVPLTGLAMVFGPANEGRWVKAGPATMNPALSVSLHAHADGLAGRASFAAGLHGAWLPSMPVACGGDLPAACTLSTDPTFTGRPHLVAEIDGAAFHVVLFPGSVLQVSRNRLWRLREELASSLPADLRRLLTRGRTGDL